MSTDKHFAEKLIQKQAHDQFSIDQAIRNLLSVTRERRGHTLADPFSTSTNCTQSRLLEAMASIGSFLGTPLRRVPQLPSGQRLDEMVEAIALQMGLAARRVSLDGDWWKTNRGPLLLVNNDGTPLAGLPRFWGGYRFPRKTRSADISPKGISFYRTLDESELRFRDLFRLLFSAENARDLVFALVIGLLSSALALAVPLFTGTIVDNAIPKSDVGLLLSIGLGLFFVNFGSANFGYFRSLVFNRINSRFDFAVPIALIDRLVRLPAKFFRTYSSGDLTDRVFGSTNVVKTSTTIALDSIVSFFFSFFYLLLIFSYSSLIGGVVLGGTAVLTAVMLIGNPPIYRYKKLAAEENGKIFGIVVQFMRGIDKLRVAHAEKRVFSKWTERFSWMRRQEFKASTIANGLEVFSQLGVLLITATIVYLFAGQAFGQQQNQLTVGDYMVISSAFGLFQTAMFGAFNSVISLLAELPALKRVQPLLDTSIEPVANRVHTELSGKIELNQVTFGYESSSIPAIIDLTLKIEPGEFVAVIGPSGSGKTTLAKLLLGFWAPQSGSLFYDNRDLRSLNLRSVRQQIGTVLQDGELMHGTILQNIIGMSKRTIEDAWNAASTAALADDIKKMPMQMHTMISEGAKTISGGQKQRILLARALVNKPNVLILDEATSALDNHTQTEVQQNLDELTITRVVIAHRLSTVINADRVVVLREGRIVQQGKPSDVMREEGYFKAAVSRQVM